MRIIGGGWRGRRLAAPAGVATRPTAERARQALFDRLTHAAWADGLLGVVVLDVFAGTGAFGLEALSRGAARAGFIERDRAALAALRANVGACGAEERCRVVAGDATRPPACPPGWAAGLVFLDPPYGQGLVVSSVAALTAGGWLAAGALLVAELGEQDAPPPWVKLADWRHGVARMVAWRQG